jgi:hypothetical protein
LMKRDALTAEELDELIAYNRELVAWYEKSVAKSVAEERAAQRKAALKSGVMPISLWRKERADVNL